VQKGVLTGVEVSPALHVQRPDDGVWVSPGPELDALARHVSDIVIPTLVTGMALPDALPAEVDLSDTGETLVERLITGGSTRAHDRARVLSLNAYFEAMDGDVKFAPIETPGDAQSEQP
jgi:hypothetical protein